MELSLRSHCARRGSGLDSSKQVQLLKRQHLPPGCATSTASQCSAMLLVRWPGCRSQFWASLVRNSTRAGPTPVQGPRPKHLLPFCPPLPGSSRSETGLEVWPTGQEAISRGYRHAVDPLEVEGRQETKLEMGFRGHHGALRHPAAFTELLHRASRNLPHRVSS